MSKIIIVPPDANYNFETISDFKWCMKCGGEVEFVFHDSIFGMFPKLKQSDAACEQILIVQKDVENQKNTEKWCNTADEVLEYMIDGVCLRDIITEVEVTERTI